MRVALLLARSAVRRRMTSWVLVALVVAIAGAVTLGCLAAARRTASSHARYQGATNTSDVRFSSDPQCGERPCSVDVFTDIEGVAAVSRLVRLIPALEAPDGSLDPDGDKSAYFGLSLGQGWEHDRPLLNAGRLPNVDAADEAFVTTTFASAHHLGVGDEFAMRSFTEDELPGIFAEAEGGPKTGRTVRLRVTAVGLVGGDLSASGVVVLPPLAAQQLTPIGASFGIELERGAAGVDEFAKTVDERFGLVVDTTATSTHEKAQRMMRPYVVALAAYAAVAAILGIVLVGQAAARNARASADESALLLAIGVTRWQRRGRIAAGVGAAAVLGTLLGGLAALAASSWSPVGPVGPFEPNSGVSADLTILVLGGLAWIVLTSAAGIGGIVLADRVRRHRVAGDTRVARRLPVTTATALRFTRPQSTGSNSGSARPAIAGVATGVLVLTCVVTFAAGLDRLVDTPRLYGWTFDTTVFLGYGSLEEDNRAAAAAALAPQLRDEPAVEGVTEMAGTDLDIGELTVSATGTAGAGGAFTLTSGQPPAAPNEIVFGSHTASNLRAGGDIGSTVKVGVGADSSSSADYTVVGRAVFPGTSGDGAWMTLEGLHALVPDTPVSQLGVRFVPGTSIDDATAVLQRGANTLQPLTPEASVDVPIPPSDTEGLVGIDQLPLLLGIALGVATMVTLTHTLLLALRARRRDLATLRACGYTARQVWATVLSQATIVTVAGLVIGLPLGLVAGRRLWSTWADSIGVVDTAVSPLRLLALITLTALVGALVIAVGPARHASRVRVADALRAE